MNTYTHLGLDDAVMEIHRLQEQERVLGEFQEEENRHDTEDGGVDDIEA